MPANQLLVQTGDDIGNGEVPRFRGHLRVKEDLEQEISEFLAQIRPVSAFDGVEHFVGLFEGVLADGVEALLAIPRTATLSAQSSHDGDRFGKEPG